jgi:hypothetical protein
LPIKCEYDETFKSFNPADPYIEKTTKKIEEINKYFSGRVFAAGIVQRKEWLLATPEERRVWLFKNDGDIIACHPSNYK